MLGTMILMTIILLATDVGGSIKKIVIELWCWWRFWDIGLRGWYKEIVDAGDEKEYVTNILNLSPTYSIANIELNRLCNICLEAAIWLSMGLWFDENYYDDYVSELVEFLLRREGSSRFWLVENVSESASIIF